MIDDKLRVRAWDDYTDRMLYNDQFRIGYDGHNGLYAWLPADEQEALEIMLSFGANSIEAFPIFDKDIVQNKNGAFGIVNWDKLRGAWIIKWDNSAKDQLFLRCKERSWLIIVGNELKNPVLTKYIENKRKALKE